MSEADSSTGHTSNPAACIVPKLGKYKGKAARARANSAIIVECSTACPFKWSSNLGFRCICCNLQVEPTKLREHTSQAHNPEKFVNVIKTLRKETPIKVDVTRVECRLCGEDCIDLPTLKMHLTNSHDKAFIGDDLMIPFKLKGGKPEELECQVCSMPFKHFNILNQHMNNHYSKFICEICSYGFTSHNSLMTHRKLHDKKDSSMIDRFLERHQTEENKKKVLQESKKSDEVSIKLQQSIREKDAKTKANTCVLLECSTVVPFKWALCSGIRCFYCSYQFEDPEELRRHTMKCHNSSKAKSIMRYVTKEVPVKVDITQIFCKLCFTQFDSVDNINRHLSDIHQKTFHEDANYGILPFKLELNKYDCVVCNKIHRTFHTLNHHMTKHFGSYICHYCGKRFLSYGTLTTHQKAHEQGFKCHICGEPFPTISKRVLHKRTVHDAERIKCTECSETFPDYQDRKIHTIKAHGAEHLKYFCKCGKSFLRQRGLSFHVRKVHLNERNFECDICQEKFFVRHHLLKHLVKHSDERNFNCYLCGVSFKRKRGLEMHERIHNNDKRYVCKMCGQSFVQSSSLLSHTRTHHTDMLR